MQNLNKEPTIAINIDLTAAKKGKVNEGYFTALGWQVEWLLKQMFAGGDLMGTANITGTPSQISSFMETLENEKRYMDTYMKYGLGDKRTFSDKWQLDQAVQGFEMETGLKWPFK